MMRLWKTEVFDLLRVFMAFSLKITKSYFEKLIDLTMVLVGKLFPNCFLDFRKG